MRHYEAYFSSTLHLDAPNAITVLPLSERRGLEEVRLSMLSLISAFPCLSVHSHRKTGGGLVDYQICKLTHI